MSSNSSDSGISISDESITEFSTCGLSLRTDRSKSPFADFKDEQISTSELVSEWLDQVEIRRSELLDAEEEQQRRRIGRILNETAVLLVGVIGLSIIIMFLLILLAAGLVSGCPYVSVDLKI